MRFKNNDISNTGLIHGFKIFCFNKMYLNVLDFNVYFPLNSPNVVNQG